MKMLKMLKKVKEKSCFSSEISLLPGTILMEV